MAETLDNIWSEAIKLIATNKQFIIEFEWVSTCQVLEGQYTFDDHGRNTMLAEIDQWLLQEWGDIFLVVTSR